MDNTRHRSQNLHIYRSPALSLMKNSSFLDASVVDEGTKPKDDIEGKEDEPSDRNPIRLKILFQHLSTEKKRKY